MSFKGYIRSSQVFTSAGAASGLYAGLLGMLEAAYYGSNKPGGIVYGFGMYAVLGSVYGWIMAVFFGGKARNSRIALRNWAGKVSGWLVGVQILVVWGFLNYRDVWNESISKTGFMGWLAMAGVVIAALVGMVVVRRTTGLLMSRSEVVNVLLLALALMGIVLGRPIETEVAEYVDPNDRNPDSRPPIVFVVVDALRYDEAQTPHLEAFKQDAVNYAAAWSSSSWTRPSVASLLSGLYPDNHRTIHKTDRFPNEVPTLASVLRDTGYVTVASITNVNLAPVFGLGKGFDNWSYLAPQPFMMAPVSASRLFVVELYRLMKLRFFPGHRDVESYYARGERVLERAEALIKPLAKSKSAFFAYLHFMEPHDPYFSHPYDGHAVARVENPNPPLGQAASMRELYRQEIQHFDDLFGALMKFLKSNQLYDNALIVVTSDHGEEFGDHGGFWHGTSLYEELIHVPLVIRFPGGLAAGTTHADPVSLVDLMPTALQVAGVEAQDALDGLSLVAPWDAKNPRRVFASVDHQGCIVRAVREGDWKMMLANPGNPRNLVAEHLVHLSTDPEEKENLAEQERQRLAELKQWLQAGLHGSSSGRKMEGEAAHIDDQTREQLRSLGYTE